MKKKPQRYGVVLTSTDLARIKMIRRKYALNTNIAAIRLALKEVGDRMEKINEQTV